MAQTTTLEHVNVPPAQTWNYLKINDIALTLPAAAGEPVAAGAFDGVETGAGAEATAWVLASAPTRVELNVGAGGSETLEILADGSNQGLAHDVRVGEGATMRIVVVATGQAGFGSALRVRADKGASVEVTLFDAVDDGATYLDTSGFALAEDAALDVRHYVLTAGTSALGTCVACDGAGSAATLTTRHLTGTGNTLDMNYLVRQRGANSRSTISVSGVLAEGATKNLCDTIDLIHGCKGAAGLENEVVLLAGENVVNKSLPTILCDEDDVSGNHGATIGSIAPGQLEYLAERGLTPAEVTELFQRSVIEDALTHARALGSEVAVAATLASAERVLGTEAAAELR